MYDFNKYIKDATRTESPTKTITTDPDLLAGVLQAFIATGTMLDQIKKNAFYGKDFDDEKMKQEFINIVASLDMIRPAIAGEQKSVVIDYNPRVFHSIIGIATESAELIEALTAPDLDPFNILEEFGDLNWYQAIGIDALGGNFENILETNINKLKTRYPEKFTSTKAINRNTDDEREILETQQVKDKD